MKNLLKISLVIITLSTIVSLKAQAQSCCAKGKPSCGKMKETSTKEAPAAVAPNDSLKVFGACGMCKARIEKAALSVKGVKDAQWNAELNMLTYTFSDKINKEDLSKALTKVGHDTELGKASDKVYDALPGCCKYRKD